jgi:hypothetical protein
VRTGDDLYGVTVVTTVSWVLLSYRVPREPSAPRIAIWRRLKRLGVAQIGDGLVALPADARTTEHLEWVAEQIAGAGGESLLWRAELATPAQERRVIGELVAARTTEYEAVITRLGETSGADAARVLSSVRAEMRQIERRDYFPPGARERARRAVRAFAARIVESEGVAS